jgi:hypothetical protein
MKYLARFLELFPGDPLEQFACFCVTFVVVGLVVLIVATSGPVNGRSVDKGNPKPRVPRY